VRRPLGSGRRLLALGLLAIAAIVVGWTWWAEDHPREERRLRTLVHDRLDAWFPEQMAPDDGWHGIHLRASAKGGQRLSVLLVHGLDEPGSIWADLVPALDGAGFTVWEFRYPNDQGIDRSADYLARGWARLPRDRPLVLIGHSMGGLVIRDFVSRIHHPVGVPAQVDGATVAGVILLGTPNLGSEWARLRVWLELRDQFPNRQGRRFSLFAGLRDGAGEAKIDLRPGSDFLRGLNARPWPEDVPILAIAGRLLAPQPGLEQGLEAASAEAGSPELGQRLQDWWSDLGDKLGDGVVTIDSARVPGQPPPLVVNASHRGMVVRIFPGDPEPPAIPLILTTLHGWDSLLSNEPGAASQ